jgi:hypothetical protein
VDKTSKGAKPGELVIDVKTAKPLGLTIPQLTLWQATEIIQ